MSTAKKLPEPLFDRGNIYMTRGISSLIEMGKLDPLPYIQRHLIGDWGDVSDSDRRANDLALLNGEQLLSAYQVNPYLRILIITESNRSVTTLILPRER